MFLFRFVVTWTAVWIIGLFAVQISEFVADYANTLCVVFSNVIILALGFLETHCMGESCLVVGYNWILVAPSSPNLVYSTKSPVLCGTCSRVYVSLSNFAWSSSYILCTICNYLLKKGWRLIKDNKISNFTFKTGQLSKLIHFHPCVRQRNLHRVHPAVSGSCVLG
jgi:hypothetical protein